jgi:uncharacterized protein YrrD
MRKGKDIIGKPVVAYDSGEKVETIVDLIFDQNDNCLLGFLIDESGWFSNAKVLPLSLVKAIGLDAVIIDSESAISPSSIYPSIHSILENNNILNGTRIMTTDGRDLGKLIDFYFDETTGRIEGYETSGGLFADAYSGRSFVPAPKTLKIGEDVAFVPAETAVMMEQQVGGLKAAMQTASEKIQETAQTTGEKLQVAAQATGEKLQEVTQTTGEKLQEAVAGLTVEQALGRRVQQSVHTADGYIIAAPGQIVTESVINRAKAAHQESALLDAVGLSTSGAATTTANDLATTAGDRLKTTTATAQVGAANLWDKVKETASDLQDRSTQALDEKRIKGALGRPTTRVILDLNDQVILNVGELITHKAVESARAAGILDVLLDSVYTETPHLSLAELRAPGDGTAAL